MRGEQEAGINKKRGLMSSEGEANVEEEDEEELEEEKEERKISRRRMRMRKGSKK